MVSGTLQLPHQPAHGRVWLHHLEEHLDITPLTYMFERFGLGLDVVSWKGTLRCLVCRCPPFTEGASSV